MTLQIRMNSLKMSIQIISRSKSRLFSLPRNRCQSNTSTDKPWTLFEMPRVSSSCTAHIFSFSASRSAATLLGLSVLEALTARFIKPLDDQGRRSPLPSSQLDRTVQAAKEHHRGGPYHMVDRFAGEYAQRRDDLILVVEDTRGTAHTTPATYPFLRPLIYIRTSMYFYSFSELSKCPKVSESLSNRTKKRRDEGTDISGFMVKIKGI